MSEQPAGELTGKTLGQYEIGKQLGQGGMATVYLARQKSIGRTVAIKVLPQQFLHDPNFLQRFEHEVKIIAALQHPRVLPVYDYGQIENRPYIVMAYIGGGTLADKIQAGPLPLEQVVQLTDQIAEGLGHAHRKGIIHRDFKPSNVLLDENGNAYLADFGIAKITESTSQLTGSAIIGTPSYMAPEMAESGQVSPAVDIYALGVTLFQMLAGRNPFQGETPIRVMMAHASEPIPDVRATRPDLPEAVTAVINKAMAKRPEDRYATTTDLARDLRRAAQGLESQAAGEELRTIGLPQRPPVPPAPVVPSHSSTGSVPSATSYTPAPLYTPTPPPPRKRGCSFGVIVGVVVGVLAVACLVAVVAFGGLAAWGSALPTDTPVPPTPTSPTTANLTIDNQSDYTICHLYISRKDDTDWGNDRLGDSTSIASGDSYVLEDIAPDTYDLRAKGCDDAIIADEYDFTLTLGEQTWEIPADMVTLTVINNESQDLCELYIVSAGKGDWGSNQLDSDQVIPSGSQYTISHIPVGSYDIKVVACGTGGTAERYAEMLDTPTEWTIGEDEG